MKSKIELYSDGIGSVEYVEHMGSDLTIVNSARVSFGKHKEEIDEKDKKCGSFKRRAISKPWRNSFKML